MRSPIRKPRVFISYSRQDLEFIQRLEKDLREGYCEPWRDEIEIRVGKPWLDEIFSTGMPTCEVVLYYFTEHSLHSEMVKLEINARVIARLSDERVHLLPYLAHEDLRRELRLDLQTLHTPILNPENYAQTLPRLIAEIWRCYSETLVAQATQGEKAKRLEAEARVKELEEKSSTSIFSASEEAEFRLAWQKLNASIKMDIHISVRHRGKEDFLTRRLCEVNFGTLFRAAFAAEVCSSDDDNIIESIKDTLVQALKLKAKAPRNPFEPLTSNNFIFKTRLLVKWRPIFLRLGFLERHLISTNANQFSMDTNENKLTFTKKFDRFNYWLDVNFPDENPEQHFLLSIKEISEFDVADA